jgi:penicillin-binding protein 2B
MGKNKKTNIMASIFMLLFLFLFLIISGRFIYIQATGETSDVSLLAWADKQRETSIALNAERGKIYDHNGMTLAYNRPTYRLYAILDEDYSKNSKQALHVVDPEITAEKLAPFLDIKPEEIKKTLDKGIKEDRFQVEFGAKGKNLSQEVMEDIRDLKLPGVYFLEDQIRYYPNGMFASHIIGFARPEGDDTNIVGVTGIEDEKNKILHGTDGFIRYQRDKYNKKLLNAKEVVKEPENGKDIYLTIDQKIQTLLEDVLSQVDEKYEPERITAVVMNPKTGEVLALSNRPSYNPNSLDEIENWYNDVISTPVEPGSTAKIFTWASAIDAGVYQGDELYQSGKYKIHEKVDPVNDHNNGAGWGMISFDEGFRRSSNVAASKLVWENIGADRFYDYLQKFDFDKITGIDLPNEVAGKISYDYPSDKLRTAFGQGSTITPIQQMKAATSIVNNGNMVQPYVIKKIVDPNSNDIIEENEPKVVGQPISEQTAEQMIDLLDSVVNSKDGTGKKYQLEDYSVIGKTGTAQMPDPNGGYLTGEENYIFSFLGMAPKDDPKLMMHVSVTKPKFTAPETGSDPVAFIFKNVIENGLHYLNIEPDMEKDIQDTELFTFPKVIGEKRKSIENALLKMGANFTFAGEGDIVDAANIEEGETFYPGQRVILITDQPKMPDVTGWSQRDIVQFVGLLDMKMESKGSGFIYQQSIKVGTKLKKKMTLKVELQAPTTKDNKSKEETE